jgi:hypothetical protein
MTRRGSWDCRHATLNRPCVQISHSGVAEQEHTDVQVAEQIGGSARGHQRVSAASVAQQSRLRPNRTDSRTVYLYIAEFGVNVLNCRRARLRGTNVSGLIACQRRRRGLPTQSDERAETITRRVSR